MAKKTFKITVEQEVSVTIETAEFTEKFFGEFNDTFFDFGTGPEALQSHVEHLAQLEARGMIGSFIEGYGPAVDMGIATNSVVTEISAA